MAHTPHAPSAGEDGMAREYVLQGGDGVISVTANVAPAAVAKVIASPPPLFLPNISPTAPPHLPYISPTSHR